MIPIDDNNISRLKAGVTGIRLSWICIEILNKTDMLVQMKGVGIMTKVARLFALNSRPISSFVRSSRLIVSLFICCCFFPLGGRKYVNHPPLLCKLRLWYQQNTHNYFFTHSFSHNTSTIVLLYVMLWKRVLISTKLVWLPRGKFHTLLWDSGIHILTVS